MLEVFIFNPFGVAGRIIFPAITMHAGLFVFNPEGVVTGITAIKT
jgi:hypothetical protein